MRWFSDTCRIFLSDKMKALRVFASAAGAIDSIRASISL